MPTDVQKRPNLPVRISSEHDGCGPNGDRRVGAGLREDVGEAHDRGRVVQQRLFAIHALHAGVGVDRLPMDFAHRVGTAARCPMRLDAVE